MTAAKSTQSAETASALPGSPPRELGRAYASLPKQCGKTALLDHLHGGTSAEWLSLVLTEAGYRVSPSSIRTYRRALAKQGGTE